MPDVSSISLSVPYDQAFSMIGVTLAEQLGATPLIYAAIAYFVFDDAFFMDDIIENTPDRTDELQWWCEDFYSEFYYLIDGLRIYYDTASYSDGKRPFQLLTATYDLREESVFIRASRNPRDSAHGNQWRFLAQSGQGTKRHRDVSKRAVRIPYIRRWTAPY